MDAEKVRQNRIARREQSILYRGEIIEAVSQMEQIMNVFISEHFCGSGDAFHRRKLQFVSTIFGKRGMALMDKYELMIFILKDSHPELYKEHETVIKSLKKVIEFRNAIAHIGLDLFQFEKGANEDFDLAMFSVEKYELTEKRITLSEKIILENKEVIQNVNLIIIQASRAAREQS